MFRGRYIKWAHVHACLFPPINGFSPGKEMFTSASLQLYFSNGGASSVAEDGSLNRGEALAVTHLPCKLLFSVSISMISCCSWWELSFSLPSGLIWKTEKTTVPINPRNPLSLKHVLTVVMNGTSRAITNIREVLCVSKLGTNRQFETRAVGIESEWAQQAWPVQFSSKLFSRTTVSPREPHDKEHPLWLPAFECRTETQAQIWMSLNWQDAVLEYQAPFSMQLPFWLVTGSLHEWETKSFITWDLMLFASGKRKFTFAPQC